MKFKLPKNKTYLYLGLAAAALGTYFLAGKDLQKLFKREKPDFTPESEQEITKVIVQKTQEPKAKGLNIDKKLVKGTKGEEVEKLQQIINVIAGARKSTSYQTPGGYTVKFPIASDGSFGNDTQAGAFFSFDVFKDQGFVTLDQARRKMAYILGYYGKPFPSGLVNTKNYKKYQELYKAGEIDASKGEKLKLETFIFG
jgi:hypothetical protein